VTPRLLHDARVAIHVALTGIMLWLGAILSLPGDQLAAVPAFRVLLVWADEPVWSVGFLMLGITGITGLFNRSLAVRYVSVTLLTTGHVFLALVAGWSAPHNTAAGVYGIYALLGIYLLYRRTYEGL